MSEINWLDLLAPTFAALLGSWMGVRMGISKMRGEMAFMRRLEWYQEASEASLRLRYGIQQVVNTNGPKNETPVADKEVALTEFDQSLESFLNIIPQSHMFARAATYRRIRRLPVMAREFANLLDQKPVGLDDAALKCLSNFKKEIAVVTRILTDDLRRHLGLKSLTPPKGLKNWFLEKKEQWKDDYPLADAMASWGLKIKTTVVETEDIEEQTPIKE